MFLFSRGQKKNPPDIQKPDIRSTITLSDYDKGDLDELLEHNLVSTVGIRKDGISSLEIKHECSDIFSGDLTLGSLANIIFENYSNLEIILPQLNISCFNLEKTYSPEEPYKKIEQKMVKTNGYSVRASTISSGTKILLEKYNGLFSNLLTFMYFFVEYILNKNKSLNESDKINPKTFVPDKECIDYIIKFIPLEGKVGSNDTLFLLWYHPKKSVNNTIKSHLFTGGSSLPHFFISSGYITSDITSDASTMYESRAISNANNSNTIPVKIYFKLNEQNSAVLEGYENDYVLSPFIQSKYIVKIINLLDRKEITTGGSNKKRIKIKHKNKIIKKKNTKKKAYIKQKKNSKKNKSLNAKKTKKKNK